MSSCASNPLLQRTTCCQAVWLDAGCSQHEQPKQKHASAEQATASSAANGQLALPSSRARCAGNSSPNTAFAAVVAFSRARTATHQTLHSHTHSPTQLLLKPTNQPLYARPAIAQHAAPAASSKLCCAHSCLGVLLCPLSRLPQGLEPGRHCRCSSCLSDHSLGVLLVQEPVLRHLQVVGGWALADATRDVIVGAVAGAEPAVVVASASNGHAA